MVDVTYDRLVRTYVKIRDKRAQIKQDWEVQDRALKDKLETLETYLLDDMRNQGTESLRTSAGTVYQTMTLVPTGSDWAAFYRWVKEHDAFDFIFKRIKADMVKDYMDQHDGATPPGVSVFKKLGVTIRRK